ncbi:MAG TPA: 30S ribosomal protein S8, partial [Proteobacteria bacterium]|nr:30S ribosomal protein S8 [Pseudomonadota bacterium]
MLTDPIADMFARIRNALTAGHETVEMPSSKMKVAIAKVLKREGYISNYRVLGDEKKPILKIVLKYEPDGKPLIKEIKRVSKPGLRRYVGYRDLPRRFHGMGIHILSTPKGIIT